jgi:hypothetical protein
MQLVQGTVLEHFTLRRVHEAQANRTRCNDMFTQVDEGQCKRRGVKYEGMTFGNIQVNSGSESRASISSDNEPNDRSQW